MKVPVSLATGVTATYSINCHKVEDINKYKKVGLVEKTLAEIKRKQSDNIRSYAAVTASVKDKIINTDR